MTIISGCITDGEMTLEEKAEYEVIDNLRERNFDVIYELLNDDMKELATVEDLEDLWDAITGEYGKIVDIDSENISTEEITEEGIDYTSVFVPCEFDSGSKLDIQVVYDKDEMVAGLWFYPI